MDTPIHESKMELMWQQKEAEDLKRWQERKIKGNPKVNAILAFLSEYCELKVKNSWSGKELYNGFESYLLGRPAVKFNFTNHVTGNFKCKSDLKTVCDQVFPYKNFKTKHYYIKTQEHIDHIKSSLKNQDQSIILG